MARGIQKKRIKMAIHPSIYLSVRLSLLDIRILFYSILSWQWHHIQNEKHKNRIVQNVCMYVFVHWFFANIWLVDIFFQFNAMDDCTAMMMMRGWIENKAKNENLIDSMFREREKKWSIFFSKNQNNDYDLWWKKSFFRFVSTKDIWELKVFLVLMFCFCLVILFFLFFPELTIQRGMEKNPSS